MSVSMEWLLLSILQELQSGKEPHLGEYRKFDISLQVFGFAVEELGRMHYLENAYVMRTGEGRLVCLAYLTSAKVTKSGKEFLARNAAFFGKENLGGEFLQLML